MDKAEYKIRLDQMSRLAANENFAEAAKIADTIDWKKVKSVRILGMVAEIYEKDNRLEDSWQVLQYALKSSKRGKMVIFRLAEMALKMGNLEEARHYCEEFERIAPHDTGRYILKYQLLRAGKAPLDEQISILKEYKEREYTERWAYELAMLYKEKGDNDKCLEECNDLILWFSEGSYVDRAIELATSIKSPNAAQKSSFRNRQKQSGEESAGAPRMGDYDGYRMREGGSGYSFILDTNSKPARMSTAKAIEKMNAAAGEALHTVRGDLRTPGAVTGSARTVFGTNNEEDIQQRLAESIREVFAGIRMPEEPVESAEEPMEQAIVYDSLEYDVDSVKALEPENFGATDLPVPAGELPVQDKAADVDLKALFAETGSALAAEILRFRENEIRTSHAAQEAKAAQENIRKALGPWAAEKETGSADVSTAGEEGTNTAGGMTSAKSGKAGTGENAAEDERAAAETVSAESEKSAAAPEASEPGEASAAGDVDEAHEASAESGTAAAAPEASEPGEASAAADVDEAHEASAESGTAAAAPEASEPGEASAAGDVDEAHEVFAESGTAAAAPEASEPGEASAAGDVDEAHEVFAESGTAAAAQAVSGAVTVSSAAEERGGFADAGFSGEEAGAAAENDVAAEEDLITEELADDRRALTETGNNAAADMSAVKTPADTDETLEDGGITASGVTGDSEAVKERVATDGYSSDFISRGSAAPADESAADAAPADEPAALDESVADAAPADEPAALDESAADAAPADEPAALDESAADAAPADEPAALDESAADAAPADEPAAGPAENKNTVSERGIEEEEAARKRALYRSLFEKETDESLGLTRPFNFQEELKNAMKGGASLEEAAREVARKAEETPVFEDVSLTESSYLLNPEKAASTVVNQADKYNLTADRPTHPETDGLDALIEAALVRRENEKRAAAIYKEAVLDREDYTMDIPEELFADEEDLRQEKMAVSGELTEISSVSVAEEETSQSLIEHIMERPEIISRLPLEPRRLDDAEIKILSYFAEVPSVREQVTVTLADVHNCSGDRTSRTGNVLIMGRQGAGKTRLADCLILLICKDLDIRAAKVGRVVAEDFNQKDPATVVSILAGGFLVIEGAGALNEETVEALNRAMEFRTDDLVVILEDEKADLKALLKGHPTFSEKFTSSITLPVFTNDELVTFARTYARELGYKMDDMGTLALYTNIGQNQKYDEPVTVGKVKEMMDKAMESANRHRLARHFSRSAKDPNGRIYLKEKDFEE